MKDKSLTKQQRRMPLMLKPLLSDVEVKKVLAQAAAEQVILNQMRKVIVS